jgi:hypothetical protein
MTDDRIGLKSDDLRAALSEAIAGRRARLGDLMSRHGGLPGPRPNLALAAAFGEAIAREGKGARVVLDAMSKEDAEDAASPRAFLAIAAAHGYAARSAIDERHAWDGLFELTADDRAPVRIGLIAALCGWAARAPGNVDRLLGHAETWLDHEDREHAFAAAAIALDVIEERRAIDGLADPAVAFSFVEQTVAAIADARRAAERSPAKRKLLATLPGAAAQLAAAVRGTPSGVDWLAARLADARHPDVRAAMEQAIERLRRGSGAQPAAVIESLRSALASSAKPPRDPARIREGMSGRGKKGRNRSR